MTFCRRIEEIARMTGFVVVVYVCMFLCKVPLNFRLWRLHAYLKSFSSSSFSICLSIHWRIIWFLRFKCARNVDHGCKKHEIMMKKTTTAIAISYLPGWMLLWLLCLMLHAFKSAGNFAYIKSWPREHNTTFVKAKRPQTEKAKDKNKRTNKKSSLIKSSINKEIYD